MSDQNNDYESNVDAPINIPSQVATGEQVATGDQVYTGDQVATGADQVDTGADQVATGADQVATGADQVATGAEQGDQGDEQGDQGDAQGADQVATIDQVSTGADQVSTGEQGATGDEQGATGEQVATGDDQGATGAPDIGEEITLKIGKSTLVSLCQNLNTNLLVNIAAYKSVLAKLKDSEKDGTKNDALDSNIATLNALESNVSELLNTVQTNLDIPEDKKIDPAKVIKEASSSDASSGNFMTKLLGAEAAAILG